ncbi:hypothetical protein K2173_003156 [Erythroxylum novogranatense]|uniref:Nucleolus and neural progenitor protein-like N-terminal domain-containing protein n=1 Tax=Erythroxylum novogranatense TaxID=1862640 RepID=A0AAV8TBH3_9ROSI|nr:hypothetical protein K2173_003156 [Erythroxylum novogranatense]
MGSDVEIEVVKERLQSFTSQLQAECGVFERMVYKNKNQHRRCSYFQYLLKVRRDLRLLQAVKLNDILNSCFQVITGEKPKQKIHLLESLKWRKCDGGTPNFMERLLGAARLLSQMVEPMLKAAVEVSVLVARSFFMGFSLTILALLILLDVVSVFNVVSCISLKKQSVKIIQGGVEVFREYYPIKRGFVTLECIWQTDKFVLLEATPKNNLISQDEGNKDASVGTSAPRYESIESFLGDDSDTEKISEDSPAKEGFAYTEGDKKGLFAGRYIETDHGKQVEQGIEVQDNLEVAGTPVKQLPPEVEPEGALTSSPSPQPLTSKSTARAVAFVSAILTANDKDVQDDESKMDISSKDSFFDLLTAGTQKRSLF